ncbi:hypothetical protein GDO86_007917 [Hymenochirus boettgeri]|uniref:BTB domain-containing protein n=1 Tax=Hymenochirus boettgeri TaxID=247094 RepID=A0A8T2IZH2_9PIPI|nr:hypothetical protein GDO86_007917 [Hymenochirus boettgeri]
MARPPVIPKFADQGLLQGNSCSLSDSLRGLIDNPQFSDVKFVVGKERKVVHAHRCILACRSKVFSRMFIQQFQEAKTPEELHIPYVLSDMHPEVFMAIIEYLYTDNVSLNNIIALEVLTSAVEYGLHDLRKRCVEFTSQTLTVEIACEALQAAVTYGQTDLKQTCMAFIETFAKEIIKTQSFRELSDLGLLSILKSDQLMIDEMPLIQAVREWAHVNSVSLCCPIQLAS